MLTFNVIIVIHTYKNKALLVVSWCHQFKSLHRKVKKTHVSALLGSRKIINKFVA